MKGTVVIEDFIVVERGYEFGWMQNAEALDEIILFGLR